MQNNDKHLMFNERKQRFPHVIMQYKFKNKRIIQKKKINKKKIKIK